MDTSKLRHPKPTARRILKGRQARAEKLVEKLTRAAVVLRDGRCRFKRATWAEAGSVSLDVAPAYAFAGHRCEGPSEWAHFGDKRRSLTRGMAPELRHTTAGSLMLCKYAHEAYDAGHLKITALTRHGCDGRLKFRWAR